ncbi:MAG: hypothetical protein JWO36_6370 [Myxococcales bacterium]|nr:hypothetical protein [Myxococcales bacterium]
MIFGWIIKMKAAILSGIISVDVTGNVISNFGRFEPLS